MSPEFESALLVLAVILLAMYSGAFNALEVLSLSRQEREDSEDGESDYTHQLVQDPIRSGIALSFARSVCALAVIATSLRVAINDLFVYANGGGHALAAAFVVVALAVPVAGARMVALRDPDGFLAFTRGLTVPTVYLLRPLADFAIRALRRVSPAMMRAIAFPVMPLKDKIESFVRQSGEGADEEQRIISSAMEFGETRVREVMVPRIDIVAINLATDREEAINTIIEAGHSRVPVYEDTIDRIVGVLYTKDLLQQAVSGEALSLRKLARPAFFVPESKMIDELLTEFRVRRQHLAVVVDEYGGTAGIVTLEDVLEELVGDIQDEFDTEEELIHRIDEDSIVCNAKIHVDEVNEALGIELPDEASDSLGGLLYQMIGQIPRVGDTWSFPPLVFEIQSVERQRIDKVTIRGISALARSSDNGVGA